MLGLFFAMDVHSEFSTLEWPGRVCGFFLLIKGICIKMKDAAFRTYY